MKIKIIDLLNKIVNEEESINVETKYDSDDWVKDDFLFSLYQEFEHKNNYGIVELLNDYVEIIEEPKIGKIKQLNNVAGCKGLIELKDKQQINNHILKDKINELIDEINNLKEKKWNNKLMNWVGNRKDWYYA